MVKRMMNIVVINLRTLQNFSIGGQLLKGGDDGS